VYGERLPDALDLLLLGMGEDGHTASLFPGSPALGERAARVAVVTGPKPPNPRLTITPPVIGGARATIVLVSGAGTAEALARAIEGPLDPAAVPAQLARSGSWIVDRDAARLLKTAPA
jgi:6-phosphogluconolactonase